ncbi:MAG: ABC-ATPase UvrA [Candidatus Colwellbacteria bacterium RIFCSPLOWO2_12_FULL_43_11]|uniref:UvrABC system protein A n=1 Tax=Candidatus Colwellbacteria bacterium RIFCSPLOWO2_12_FULL_43_11 TaxID=1797693 RepID=A0A1G1Z9I7_9BACT|nr:MAG: ABC-ATPase UvrA [Candidatus Colwellbacteria bacterium RIFCSPLOWO2_12_FULL_43_11]
MQDKIIIKGAREHNLKNINLELPRNKMVVFTGLSGSGKSSLAFDTIFAEGQRRYIESLSAYARQFLGRLDKPDVDEIEGLSPAISIDQKAHSSNPRSTVATITEIYDYLRVLFARAGVPYCPICGTEIRRMTPEGIVDAIVALAAPEGKIKKELVILAPTIRGRKGEYYQLLYDFLSAGFREARVDGEFKSLRERMTMARYKQHTIELVVDRMTAGIDLTDKDNRLRLSEAVEAALKHGNDVVTGVSGDQEVSFSAKFSCPRDNFSFPDIEPRLFSFNSPYGACPECHGLGTEDIWSERICKVCLGKRLRPESLSVLMEGKNITEVTSISVEDSYEFFGRLDKKLKDKARDISETPLREIRNRLKFMIDVGLGYLTLDRKAGTLSGGESQRIRLASQIGSRLVGTLYILDEPTIGLHQKDNAKLIKTLHDLRDLGNTIIVVEHDEETIRSADYLVDIGPAAGIHGGKIVAEGPIPEIFKDKKQKSLTLDYLRGDESIKAPAKRRPIKLPGDFIKLRGVSQNNLKNLNLDIPLRHLVAVTGVSGSGKSTLVYDVLYKAVANRFNHANYKEGAYKSILGLEYINRVINVDQGAIGRTPRSNPATYIGAWTHIRDLFASTEDARVRGWKPGRFSFNVRGGRCENCEGHGYLSIEMHFLPTVYVTCDTCHGKRFDRETLEVEYHRKNIYEVLKMTVEEAVGFFKDIPWLHEKLQILEDVGLGYLELGQSATTLSGGEAQRIKLSAELGKRDTRRTLYLLDEPTTGLHFDDVKKLLEVLQKLVDRGNTVVVIEHNLDVIKSADWVFDLGPEGGSKGGEIVAKGTPEDIVRTKGSFTGEYLRKVLK